MGGWARRGGRPEGVVAWRGGVRQVGAQNFALFFLSPAGDFILSSLSGGLLVEIWWCLKTRTLKRARLEFSGCRVQAPAARSGGAAGVSHDSPRAQTCTFEGTGLQKHHQNSTKRPPQRMKFSVGEKNKSEILGVSGERRSGGGVSGGESQKS